MDISNSIIDRFFAKVRKGPNPDDCWIWIGGTAAGYGKFFLMGDWRTRRKLVMFAHRFSYVVHIGGIPEGLDVLHECDNPVCVNPSHLSVGTHRENMADMVRRGRAGKNKGSKVPWSILTEDKVREMRARHAKGEKVSDIARDYGVQYHTAWSAIRKTSRNWKHVI